MILVFIFLALVFSGLCFAGVIVFKPNDWYPVWVDNGFYYCNSLRRSTFCAYEIRYSKSRGKYKLIVKGKDAISKPAYKVAVAELNKLINNG